MASEMEESIENPLVEPQPQSEQSLPQYSEMIMAAIEALNEESGSNKSAISKHIEEAYGNLPAAHETLLSHHLNRMKQSGELAMVKNNYMKPDPNAPPRRGRGRPPKPKSDSAPIDAVASPPRPRGRPPKARDPFAPPPKEKPAAVPGRSRGRPPKKQKTETAETSPSPAPAAVDGVVAPPRGRGRPPKVKPAMSPVVC